MAAFALYKGGLSGSSRDRLVPQELDIHYLALYRKSCKVGPRTMSRAVSLDWERDPVTSRGFEVDSCLHLLPDVEVRS